MTLSDAGRAMALKGAMIGLRGGMKYYRSGASGAADLMGDLMVELRRGESDATQLRLAADKLPPRARWRRSCTTWRRSMRNTTGASRESIRTARTRSAAARSFAGSCGELKDAYVFADGFDVLPAHGAAAAGGAGRRVPRGLCDL